MSQVNSWQATRAHAFDSYGSGLNHLAFNVTSRSAVDDIHRLVVDMGAEVLDGPGDFPFAHRGYYAVYFLRPDRVKIEVVHMSGLVEAIEKGKAGAA